jgi:hypothetical protein
MERGFHAFTYRKYSKHPAYDRKSASGTLLPKSLSKNSLRVFVSRPFVAQFKKSHFFTKTVIPIFLGAQKVQFTDGRSKSEDGLSKLSLLHFCPISCSCTIRIELKLDRFNQHLEQILDQYEYP